MTTARIDGTPDGDGTTIVLHWTADLTPAIAYLGARLAPGTDLDALVASLTPPLPHATLDVLPRIPLVPEAARGFMGHPGVMLDRAPLGPEGGPPRGTLTVAEADVSDHAARFTLRDERSRLALVLDLALDPETDVATASTRLRNEGAPLAVDWLSVPVVAVPARYTERLRFQGRWCAEFDAVRGPIRRGLSLDENRRGRTSHESFPGTVLLTPATSHTVRSGKAGRFWTGGPPPTSQETWRRRPASTWV